MKKLNSRRAKARREPGGVRAWAGETGRGLKIFQRCYGGNAALVWNEIENKHTTKKPIEKVTNSLSAPPHFSFCCVRRTSCASLLLKWLTEVSPKLTEALSCEIPDLRFGQMRNSLSCEIPDPLSTVNLKFRTGRAVRGGTGSKGPNRTFCGIRS